MFKRIILLLPLIAGFLTMPYSISTAQQKNRAGLIMQIEGGAMETYCISFDSEKMTGYELLERSGLDLEVNISAFGTAVCSIDGVGCPADDSCLKCQAPLYWSYWQLSDSGWIYSVQGTSTSEITDGDVEAWVWGTGDPPDLVTFDEICNQSPTSTPSPSKTNTPLPTFTTLPSSTPFRSNTSQHTVTATNTYTPYPTSSPTIFPSFTPLPNQLNADASNFTSTQPVSTQTTPLDSQPSPTITPIVVRNIPTEPAEIFPSTDSFLPKKAGQEQPATRNQILITPTVTTEEEINIYSIIGAVIQRVQNLVDDFLP